MIFVNIACYRDPEIGPTLRDLFRKARHPERINVGLVLQTRPADGIFLSHGRVRIIALDAAEARGPCHARALGHGLWRDEEHVLQIDSHMRFAPDWDTRLLDQLAACDSAKPLLTTYPPGYEPPNHRVGDSPAFLAAKHFDERGILIQHGLIEPPPAKPRPTAFLAAGFLFGPSAWIREVPYDPGLYFHGEEATLAVRLWTHGWDLFGPTEALIWHQYTKVVRPLHWGDDPRWEGMDALSLARMRRILGMPPEPTDGVVEPGAHGLGDVRTLEQYQLMSGVDFRARTLTANALAGVCGPFG